MSGWSDIASFAKTALSSAQKKIDTVLDIKEENANETVTNEDQYDARHQASSSGATISKLQDDFFSAFGLQSPSQAQEVENSSEISTDSSNKPQKWSTWLSGAADNLPKPKTKWSSWLGGTMPVDDDDKLQKDLRQEEKSKNDGDFEVKFEAADLNFEDSPSKMTKNNSDGWCTESLLVPKEDSSFVVANLMSPTENYSNFLSPSAQLTLVDDIDEGGRDFDAQEEERMSAHRVSSWVVPPLLLDVSDDDDVGEYLGATAKDGGVLTPRVVQENFFMESDSSEKSLCTMIAAGEMSTSSKSQDTVIDESNRKEELNGSGLFLKEDPNEEFTRQASECVEDILTQLSQEGFSAAPPDIYLSEESCSHDEELSGMADSFVQLDAGNISPPASQQKSSETSSSLKEGGTSGNSSPVEDMETNASSDIEIISTPNGGDAASVCSSRSGIMRLYSTNLAEHLSKKTHRRVNSDQDVAELTARGKMNAACTENEKKVEHLNEVLEAREHKLLEISKENVQLADENEQLRRELQAVHSRISSTMSENELMQKCSNLERKLEMNAKEKESLKKRCESLEKEICTRITPQQFQQMLQDKEEQIQQLMQEGEKLSRKELKHNTIVKKIREKEKENEKTIENQRTKLLEMDSLKRKLRSKEEQELKYDEMVIELKNAVQKQEKVIESLQSDADDAREKCASYKSALENCAREIAELRKDCATKDSEIQQFVDKAEESKESELHEKLESVSKRFHEERQRLTSEIENVKLVSVQNIEEFQRREKSMRWEINQLQQKLQEAEFRNQELSESIATATKPLLRQIDSLQISFQHQQNNWERLEKSLYERLGDAEKKVLVAQEKEQMASSSLAEARSKSANADNQISALKREKQKLEQIVSNVERDSAASANLQKKCLDELDMEKDAHAAAILEMQKEKDLLVNQFEFEKNQLKSMSEQKLVEMSSKLADKETIINALRHQLIDEQRVNQQESNMKVQSATPMLSYRNQSASPSSVSVTNVDDSGNDDFWAPDVTNGGYSTFVERLRSKLQQREGELSVLKDELKYVQNSRDAIASSLISVSNEKQEVENDLRQVTSLKEQFNVLNVNYQALLQMYGEKVEENDELKMDLVDVKNLYKQQLEDLLKHST